MTDVHALSGAYAVDALDDLERARFERHLSECPDCQDEVASLREASALLAETVSVAPPASLRAKVLADITTVRPLAPLVADPEQAPRRRWLQGLVAAAAAVTVLGAGGVIVDQLNNDPTSQAELTAPERVIRSDDARRIVQQFDDGSKATVVISDKLRQAVVVTEGMAPPPPGKVYELWYQQPGKGMVPAGLMPNDPDATVLLDGDARSAVAIGITVEPEGGSPTGTPSDEGVTEFALDA